MIRTDGYSGPYDDVEEKYTETPAGILYLDLPFMQNNLHVINAKHNQWIPIAYSHEQHQHYRMDMRLSCDRIEQSFIVKAFNVNGDQLLFESERADTDPAGGRIHQIDIVFEYTPSENFF